MKYSIFFFVFLFSCSPQKQFNRLTKRHPYLLGSGIVFWRDTLVKKDTVILFQRVDSFQIIKDTVINTKHFYIERKNDILKIITKVDTVFIADTFFYEKKIPVPFLKNETGAWQKFKYFWLSFWIFVIIFLFLRYLFIYYL